MDDGSLNAGGELCVENLAPKAVVFGVVGAEQRAGFGRKGLAVEMRRSRLVAKRVNFGAHFPRLGLDVIHALDRLGHLKHLAVGVFCTQRHAKAVQPLGEHVEALLLVELGVGLIHVVEHLFTELLVVLHSIDVVAFGVDRKAGQDDHRQIGGEIVAAARLKFLKVIGAPEVSSGIFAVGAELE